MDNELLYLRRELSVGPLAINRGGVRERAEAYCKKLRVANISIDYIAYLLGRSCAFIAALVGEYHASTDICLRNPPPMHDPINAESRGSKSEKKYPRKPHIGRTLYVGQHQKREFLLTPKLAYSLAEKYYNGATYQHIADDNNISPTLVAEIVREVCSEYPNLSGKVTDTWPRAQN